ncbi:hypothetical protein AHiyo6_19910 [Arthrobacter sp. Hiyo6]|jgi:hypothetical protein|nr:hypothetical protein AHiyo6_19910 [Arthrobacter sp. Hiyo6]
MTEKSTPVFRPPRDGDRVSVSVRASIGSPVEVYWIVYRAALKQWETRPADDQTPQTTDVAGRQHYPRVGRVVPGPQRGASLVIKERGPSRLRIPTV